MSIKRHKKITHFISRLCKGKSDKELRDAELNFLRLLELAEDVYKSNKQKEKNNLP